MIYAAILGYGTVGSGTYLFLHDNRERIKRRLGAEIKVKLILDIKEEIGGKAQDCLTHDWSDVLQDDEVSILIETMGGLEPAYSYVKAALAKGKSVVTSNKELVAAYGGELLGLAKANSANFLFEASVGGGIPLIRPIEQTLALEDVAEISGILNGTANYVLTRMNSHGLSFDEAVKEAQERGYAERDPSADISGADTCRKLAIILSLITGCRVDYNDIPTEGISNITKADFEQAAALNKTIKLLGTARLDNGLIRARVAPFLIDIKNPIAAADNEYNAVIVTNPSGDRVMFYGKGAGKMPTAGSIVTDVVLCAKNPGKYVSCEWEPQKQEILPLNPETIGGMYTC